MAVEPANLIEIKCNLQQLLSANLALIPKGGGGVSYKQCGNVLKRGPTEAICLQEIKKPIEAIWLQEKVRLQLL